MATTLPLEEYERYGRQLILDGFGLPAQLALQNASVVVVGAGGLGCPALQYLAAAGVGTLAIIDHDVVELSNLQRQILHSQHTLGIPKALSAAQAVNQINPRTKVIPITTALLPSNALSLLSPYDIILDCTDNAPTRYLLSDTAVALKKPLVSGAAQKFDGQLCVYNLRNQGPCYRCLFPKPVAPELTGGCSELGVLGVVTGIIGNLQALETIKIITGLHDNNPSLLIFSALSSPSFRSIKLRPKRQSCPACFPSPSPSISTPPSTLPSSSTEINGRGRKEEISETDYVAFCGGERPDWVSTGLEIGNDRKSLRINALDLHTTLSKQGQTNNTEHKRHLRVVDVRPRVEFGICHLEGSINIPLSEFVSNPTAHIPSFPNNISSPSDPTHATGVEEIHETYFVCRLGNDSQLAVDALLSSLPHDGEERRRLVVKDLVGGLRAWSRDVDNEFPVY